MCTALLCIDISPDTPCCSYMLAAETILRASASKSHTWQTLYVSSDILENPSSQDFSAIIDAVLKCPNIEEFGIFCWTIPAMGSLDIKRLASNHPTLKRWGLPPPKTGPVAATADTLPLRGRISLEHNMVYRKDLEALEHFAKASRTALKLGYTI